MKTTVIHHSADYDGIFCREIARNFLPDAELIGWDFADKPLEIPEGQIYVMDLPIDRVFGFKWDNEVHSFRFENPGRQLIWIDHHKSSIETHPSGIPGYRIDGVAACRLAWQWFQLSRHHAVHAVDTLPGKQAFIDRKAVEPLAVRLAGEYDVWDHRGDGDLEFQFGLKLVDQGSDFWEALLQTDSVGEKAALHIIEEGKTLQRYQYRVDADILRARSFIVEWEGLKFLALNTARCNSNTFASLDIPDTGHDALMAFCWNGVLWTVSLYHSKVHRKDDFDLSQIAVKYGGGGHRGACGFTCKQLPFYGHPS